MRSGKRLLQLALSLAISGVFIWYAVRGIDFARVLSELRRAEYVYVLPTLIALCACQYLRAWRFRYLAEPVARMEFPSLLRISNIGLMAVLLLPVRLGEFVRPYLMKREHSASMSAALGAVAAERVIDGLVVTLGFFVLTQAGVTIPDEMSKAGLLALAVFAGAGTALGILLVGHERGAAILRAPIALISPRLADRVVRILSSFARGLEALRSVRALGIYLAWTLFFWGMQGLTNWTLFSAMSMELPLSAGFILVGLTVIALMLPSGPGFIGPIQAAVVWGLGLYSIEREKAFAFSILVHAISALVTITFGVASLLAAHMSMSSLVKASQAEANETA